MSLFSFFNLSKEKRNRLFRSADRKRSILAMALVYELVSQIMSKDKLVCKLRYTDIKK